MGETMEKKIGVYICKGCEIGDRLDVAKLSGVAQGYSPAVLKNFDAACGDAGIAEIRNDIESEGINTVVVAACSSRVLTDTFDFGTDALVERVNIREQVIWTHVPEESDEEAGAAEGETAEEPAGEEAAAETAPEEPAGGGFKLKGGRKRRPGRHLYAHDR